MAEVNGDRHGEALAALQHLIEVVAQLRHPQEGCPWDLQQTPESLMPYVIEEAYEVVDAIQQGQRDAIAEELGDLLLQVVLQAQIASEAGDFAMAQVAQGITEKLIRRHPHVFGEVQVQDVEEVHRNWDRIKAQEKGQTHDPHRLTPKLRKYSRTLPPLMATLKISKKAAAAGFEWDTIDAVWDKFQEELQEFRQALAQESPEQQQAELGDLLFTLVNLARWYDLDPAAALQGTNRRFIQRFAQVEQRAQQPFDGLFPRRTRGIVAAGETNPSPRSMPESLRLCSR
ncbi:Nucleoside triphosphate pyrophosphohydrolase [Halomicronema hongdechloris C2206]|uniref:Nucleoside triphosphate pyrophosphohydrolase n=1 Tax=Halomicronema hongdechloris C2206 TaxID=1641165 RepID=A0A1Z3HKB9_9CYAN|nr:nucleoside triphosphate pyrophosphohydrolase [Halomicronema hongdechloris]ASC70735.1 Nucleoside triphosphate pyrophosphohydrolase [Halomicronema hongdechloris C2206]